MQQKQHSMDCMNPEEQTNFTLFVIFGTIALFGPAILVLDAFFDSKILLSIGCFNFGLAGSLFAVVKQNWIESKNAA